MLCLLCMRGRPIWIIPTRLLSPVVFRARKPLSAWFTPYVPDGKEIMTCDNIDEVLPALNTVKYLSWPSKDLRNLAGFDVRIKLPEPAKRETK